MPARQRDELNQLPPDRQRRQRGRVSDGVPMTEGTAVGIRTAGPGRDTKVPADCQRVLDEEWGGSSNTKIRRQRERTVPEGVTEQEDRPRDEAYLK